MLSKIRVGPALVTASARANAPKLLSPAQQAAETSAQPAIQSLKRRLAIILTEEVEPAPLNRRQLSADRRQAAWTVAPCQGAHPVPQFFHALLAGPTPLSLVVPAVPRLGSTRAEPEPGRDGERVLCYLRSEAAVVQAHRDAAAASLPVSKWALLVGKRHPSDREPSTFSRSD